MIMFVALDAYFFVTKFVLLDVYFFIAQITLSSSRLDTTRHVRRVEPMHFGCVKLVEQHYST